MAEVLERSILLPMDMEALRKIRQLELFLSLKKDLTMVSLSVHFFFFFSCVSDIFLCFLYADYPRSFWGRGMGQ